MNSERKAPTRPFATIGALAERGGRVTKATSRLPIARLVVASGDRAGNAVIAEGLERLGDEGQRPHWHHHV
ncbi:hypothetical protein C5O80_20815 [Burkholderia sp. SRS-46]|nr:hypothetical protein C5O80_20815 [Burkholderia sp. SRS-46]